MNLEDLKYSISNSNINCQGCSISEIETFEKEYNISLPDSYKEFLLICGSKSEDLFCGHTIELKHWNYIQEAGIKSYEQALKVKCSSNIIFILEHQGYSHYYLNLNEGQNPDVYLLIYGDEITNKKIGKIEDFLNQEIRQLIK